MSNELDIQNEWEENTQKTHSGSSDGDSRSCCGFQKYWLIFFIRISLSMRMVRRLEFVHFYSTLFTASILWCYSFGVALD